MKSLKFLVTERKLDRIPSYDLVFEWEDIFLQNLSCKFYFLSSFENFLNRICRKLPFRVPFFTNIKGLHFEMIAETSSTLFNNKNVIPCIIDYYLKDEQITDFVKAHDKNPFILITSKEVYDKLYEKSIPIKFYHFPLSISDKYSIFKKWNSKKYDLVLAGRQNPLLDKFVQKYAQENPTFTYVYRKMDNKRRHWYYNNKNELIGEFSGREAYIELMKMSRIGLYSTPGIDGGEKCTNGFNQITPRLLEYICAGCNVIARFPENKDVEFYELDKITNSVRTYDDFRMLMEKYRKEAPDYEFYDTYIEKHRTSERVKLLNQILKDNE